MLINHSCWAIVALSGWSVKLGEDHSDPIIFECASAAEIVVTANTDGSAAANECELRDAILAANTDAAVDGCPAGNGNDRITFGQTPGGITLESSLPAISESLEIAGPGVDDMMINGDDQYRIFHTQFVPEFITIRGLHLFAGFGDRGGCLHVGQSVTMLFEDLQLETCQAGSFAGGGASVSGFEGSNVTFRRVEFLNNRAEQGGGGLSLNAEQALIEDSLFQANQVVGPAAGGGALSVGVGTLTITRSTFWNNSARRQGSALRIFTSVSTVDIKHSTFSDNDITGTTTFDIGGAIYNVGSLSLFNTVVAKNTESNVNHATVDILNDGSGVLTTLGFNLVGNNEGSDSVFPAGVQANWDRAGTAATPLDAKLANLAENGGVTRTTMPLADSPLVDMGSCPGELQDQRGYFNSSTGFRPVDAPGPAEPDDACDTGAAEYLADQPEPLFEDGFEG